jgi:hypothetical protein
MIKYVELHRFRGFERLRAEFSPQTYIVGPNSAGKSTVLEAIGFAEHCLRTARRKASASSQLHSGRSVRSFPMPPTIDNSDDPVRFDFGVEETRVTVQWDNGARVHLIWPEEDSDRNSGFFYLEDGDGMQPTTPAAVKSLFGSVEILPVVTPLDHSEELKNPTYIELHRSSRLASRHFRNHAFAMHRGGDWEKFKEFCQIWMPEIQLLDVKLMIPQNRLAVFYSEPQSRVPKELSWAGDGIQIWVQLLWHVFKANAPRTIVLDEPEVYLHPDLQRRLVRLLDGLPTQVVMASHSAEVIAEAPREGVLWVDRRTGGARRAKSQGAVASLSASLGSSYNLALARSMRARLVVASDCSEPRIIRQLARQVGAIELCNEHSVSIVQTRDVSLWVSNTQLGESLREVLPPNLPAVLLLQAGNRSKEFNQKLARQLTASGVTAVFLERPEFENYLLDTDSLARASGAAPESIAVQIADACEGLQGKTRADYIAAAISESSPDLGATVRTAEAEFDRRWQDVQGRTSLVRGSDLLATLNAWLEKGGYRLVTGLSVAKVTKPQVVAGELLAVLHNINEMVS